MKNHEDPPAAADPIVARALAARIAARQRSERRQWTLRWLRMWLSGLRPRPPRNASPRLDPPSRLAGAATPRAWPRMTGRRMNRASITRALA